MALASFLGVSLPELMNVETTDRSVPLLSAPGRIRSHLDNTKMSLEEFEQRIGWELGDFLVSPLSAAAERPILFLQVLAAHLGIAWPSLIPEDDAD